MKPVNSLQRIADGSAWVAFCDTLAQAGDVILRPGSPPHAFDRAEGFRYLTRLTRIALESHLEFADPRAPVFRRPAHETVKLGADNPDNVYLSAAISGETRYRVWGSRGTVSYLGFGTYFGGYGSSGPIGQSGYLEAKDLEIAPDGRFEISLCCEEQPGNWLPMQADTSLLIVRQTCRDRAEETLAELHIECLDGDAPQPVAAEAIDRGLAAAAAYVAGTAGLFADWAEGFARRKNELPRFDPAVAAAAHGDPNICYYHGYWELAPGEALVVTVTPPACDYWNFQLGNHWMESLDYRYHKIDVNQRGARMEADGSVRLVVAAKDPGFGNWLDTAGHERGTMCLRWVRAESHPDPATRVVKLRGIRND